jgi:ABC-type transport system involved in multi-copper enzyme maturation permease subunit
MGEQRAGKVKGVLAGLRLPRLVGPLFYYEVLRLARKGHSTALRCLYGLALLVGLAVTYATRIGFSHGLEDLFAPGPLLAPNTLARLGQGFAEAVLLVQTAAVYVLTPAYVAGVFVEERERGTLDLLLVSRLHDREIVLGKLVARLLQVGGVLLTGLPVLFLTQLWGGVDAGVILAVFAATGLTLLSVGGLSILCSASARGWVGALGGAYLVTALGTGACLCFPWGFWASPVTFLAGLNERLAAGLPGPVPYLAAERWPIVLQLLAGYACAHGTAALVCVLAAMLRLRALPPVEPGMTSPHVSGGSTVFAGSLTLERPRGRRRPPVGDRPLLWKERYADLPFSGTRTYFAVLGVALGGSGGVLLFIGFDALLRVLKWGEGDAKFHEAGNSAVRWLGTFATMVACLGAGFLTARSVSKERERRTLDSLLMLPEDREDILRAKWLGALLRVSPLALGLAGLWAAGVVTGCLHPLAALFLAVACGSQVVFLACLGIWLSVTVRSTLRADLVMAGVLLVLFGGPWLVQGYLPGRPGEVAFGRLLLGWGLNPLWSWWNLAFGWGGPTPWGRDVKMLCAVLLGPVLYPLAGRMLWREACKRFGRLDYAETGRWSARS